VAWLVVLVLLSVLGDQLGSLPLSLRALAISGVLVVLMANLVMPLLGQVAERWLTRRV
jgi:antibiotic biosynthesis monooxygenase (ABM) superfamily enzyme